MGGVSELWQQAALGAGGGFGAELLHWYMLARKDPKAVQAFAAGWLYWVTTLGMIALGAVMPLLYLDGSGSALLCFHLGAATPILLQKLVAAAPQVTQRQGANQRSATDASNRAQPAKVGLRAFFSW